MAISWDVWLFISRPTAELPFLQPPTAELPVLSGDRQPMETGLAWDCDPAQFLPLRLTHPHSGNQESRAPISRVTLESKWGAHSRERSVPV